MDRWSTKEVFTYGEVLLQLFMINNCLLLLIRTVNSEIKFNVNDSIPLRMESSKSWHMIKSMGCANRILMTL